MAELPCCSSPSSCCTARRGARWRGRLCEDERGACRPHRPHPTAARPSLAARPGAAPHTPPSQRRQQHTATNPGCPGGGELCGGAPQLRSWQQRAGGRNTPAEFTLRLVVARWRRSPPKVSGASTGRVGRVATCAPMCAPHAAAACVPCCLAARRHTTHALCPPPTYRRHRRTARGAGRGVRWPPGSRALILYRRRAAAWGRGGGTQRTPWLPVASLWQGGRPSPRALVRRRRLPARRRRGGCTQLTPQWLRGRTSSSPSRQIPLPFQASWRPCGKPTAASPSCPPTCCASRVRRREGGAPAAARAMAPTGCAPLLRPPPPPHPPLPPPSQHAAHRHCAAAAANRARACAGAGNRCGPAGRAAPCARLPVHRALHLSAVEALDLRLPAGGDRARERAAAALPRLQPVQPRLAGLLGHAAVHGELAARSARGGHQAGTRCAAPPAHWHPALSSHPLSPPPPMFCTPRRPCPG